MTTRRLVIVVGKAASGKTTLCKSLASFAFAYVSASEVLRHALGGSDLAPDRRSLAELGSLARGTLGLANFHNALLRRMDETIGDVVLDGPRFAETVEAIRLSAAYALLIYLDCPDVVRCRRLNAEGRRSDWAWMTQHPTETSVTEMRDMADFILDGAQPAHDVLQILKDTVEISYAKEIL